MNTASLRPPDHDTGASMTNRGAPPAAAPPGDDQAPHGEPLPRYTTRAAAQLLDLGRSRRLVYVGGDGEVLAAFLDSWQQLSGVWLGPAEAGDAARRFLSERGLDHRMHFVAADTLSAVPAGDLVVLSAVDAAVESSLRLLVSAGAGWLPAEGRWLILQRASPHLSSVIGPQLLQGQGLRVASRWSLSADVHMLVCAPAHRFIEALGARGERGAAGVKAS
jgi:hypothetical protein